MQEKGFYNKGVAMIKQKKLQESIDAWKSALKLDASDADARGKSGKGIDGAEKTATTAAATTTEKRPAKG
jgi:hypothetical protein